MGHILPAGIPARAITEVSDTSNNKWIMLTSDDDDDDDDELFLWYGWPMHGIALFPAGTTVRDPHHHEFWHTASRIWTCTEPEFRLWWMKLYSSDNHYTTVPLYCLNHMESHGKEAKENTFQLVYWNWLCWGLPIVWCLNNKSLQ